MTVAEKIKKCRKELSLNQEELGEKLGVHKNAVSKWERGRVTDIPMSKIRQMAELFNVPVAYLVDDSQDAGGIGEIIRLRRKELHMTLEQLGEIVGVGKSTVRKWERGEIENMRVDKIPLLVDALKVSPKVLLNCVNPTEESPGNEFTLTCPDDSMSGARLCQGDTVFVKRQSAAEDGQIIAVVLDGELMLRRVRYVENGLILWPENSAYTPVVLTGTEQSRMQLLGVADRVLVTLH